MYSSLCLNRFITSTVTRSIHLIKETKAHVLVRFFLFFLLGSLRSSSSRCCTTGNSGGGSCSGSRCGRNVHQDFIKVCLGKHIGKHFAPDELNFHVGCVQQS